MSTDYKFAELVNQKYDYAKKTYNIIIGPITED